MNTIRLKCALLVVALASLGACSEINADNYEKLKMGMSVAEIENILGKADNCSESLATKSCIWGDEEDKHIKVNFAAGSAVIFSHQGLE